MASISVCTILNMLVAKHGAYSFSQARKCVLYTEHPLNKQYHARTRCHQFLSRYGLLSRSLGMWISHLKDRLVTDSAREKNTFEQEDTEL